MEKELVIKKLEEQIKIIESVTKKKLHDHLSSITNFIINLINEFIQNKLTIEKPKENNSFSKLKINKTIKEQQSVQSICFLKDGRLVSCGKDVDIVIYKLNGYRADLTIQNAHPGHSVTSVCGLKNGNLVSGGTDTDIRIWETHGKKYKLIHTLKGHSHWINKVIELEDGKISSCSFDETIKIWENTDNYKCLKTLKGHSISVKSILEVNNRIVSGGDVGDHTVRIWSESTYECLKIINNIYCISNNGLSKLKDSAVILGGKNEVFILDILTFQARSFQNNQLGGIHSICSLRNGKVLLGNSQGMLFYFNSLTDQIIFKTKLHNDNISCLIENEDHFVSSSVDKTIKSFFIEI